jgi:hypothetical protein
MLKYPLNIGRNATREKYCYNIFRKKNLSFFVNFFKNTFIYHIYFLLQTKQTKNVSLEVFSFNFFTQETLFLYFPYVFLFFINLIQTS